MIDSILIMSVSAAILTGALLLLRPALARLISASARALAWCFVMIASLIPFRFTLQDTVSVPILTVREAVEIMIEPVYSRLPPAVISPAISSPETEVLSPAVVFSGSQKGFPGAAQEILTEAITETAPNPSAPIRNTKPVNISNIIILVWGIGAAAFLLWGFASYLLFIRKINTARVPARDGDLKVLRTFPVNLVLYRCDAVSTPMLVGLFRSCIYLPDIDYDDSALYSILAHELAHHRRYDIIIKWLSFIANAVHWFNPALYLLRRELTRECDMAADEAVICRLDKDARIGYGNMLLEMAASEKFSGSIASVTLCSGSRTLKERLEAIAGYKGKARLSILLSAALLLFIILFVFACSTTRVQNSPAERFLSPETSVSPITSASPQTETTRITGSASEPEISASAGSVDTAYPARQKEDAMYQVGESFLLEAAVDNAPASQAHVWMNSDESVFIADSGKITTVGQGLAVCIFTVDMVNDDGTITVIMEQRPVNVPDRAITATNRGFDHGKISERKDIYAGAITEKG